MVRLIYGPKGFGKTKIIIDEANQAVQNAKGKVVLIAKNKFYSVNINFDVRCIYTEDYGVNNIDSFKGFLNGIIAANFDNEYIFIDGIARITNASLDELEGFFKDIESMIADNGLKFVFTISSTREDLPEYLVKYL